MKNLILFYVFTFTCSCNLLMSENYGEVKDSWSTFIRSLQAGDMSLARAQCTEKGWESIKKHFDVNDQNELMKLGEYLKGLKITGYDKFEQRRKLLLGKGDLIVGKSAVLFIKAEGEWKVDEFLAGK